MAIHIGDCTLCGRQHLDIFENGLCLTCQRLKNLEERIEKLEILERRLK